VKWKWQERKWRRRTISDKIATCEMDT